MTIKLDTLVYHVCEKPGDIHIPDVTAVYNQIVAANAGKYPNIFLLPEYNGNLVWADTLAWITANFDGPTGIPIMLDVFGGGEQETPTPQLTTAQIADCMAVANVQWLRFAEVIAWHLGKELPFPTEYVTGILNFARANGLKVYWCEWKIGSDTFESLKTYIAGNEDIVTVAFKTNSGDLEPKDGFNYVRNVGFTHYGATVEAWYWDTHHRDQFPAAVADLTNMPVSWMITHSYEAKAAEAEVIQFEPYWYWFDKQTGMANDNLKTLHFYVNAEMPSMEANAIILQTLQGEWMNGPAKSEIYWIDGRVESEWNQYVSRFNFVQMDEQYAVSGYSQGSTSPSDKLWLRCEVVGVGILAKTLEKDLVEVAAIREAMRVEIERIIYMYSVVGPLWDPNPGPTGALHRRRMPGVSDVMITKQPYEIENRTFSKVTINVRCKMIPYVSQS
jgi:hypothetical protein